MAKTTRVHILAKELGVKSKAIVEKCQAENLDVKNHMSTITAGLAATIREWFSEGEHKTTVESAKRVDLEKVRVKRKPKKAEPEPEVAETETPAAEPQAEGPTAAPQAVAAEPETPVAVEETPTVDAAAETPVAPAEPVVAASPEPAPTVAAEEPAVEEEAPAEGTAEIIEEPATAAAAEAPAEAEEPAEPMAPAAEVKEAKPEEPPRKERPKVVMAEPPKPKPEDIVPAGPMLEKPKPAKLTGPTVVRVESIEPEETRPRRPRTARPRRFDQPAAEPLMPGVAAPGGPAKKSRRKDKGGKGRDLGAEEEKRRQNIRRMRERDMEDRRARLAAARGETGRARPSRRIESRRGGDMGHVERPAQATISEPITVKELSSALAVKSTDIIRRLMAQGVMATANQTIATDVAEMVALEFGTELIVARQHTQQETIQQEFEKRDRTNLAKRPPVVTMLGHVDHGKTSLLDRIRETTVASGEAGGITQHIGASQVEFRGKKVTFLDTPGHEAFTAMRARGANMTDIVVLVVAADDGLMPQTIEAIHHAKAAQVDILVALNKIDLPGVDVNRVYGQLAEHELTPTEWGGNTEVVKTSAVTGQGIEELIEYLDYIAELKDYKADSTVPAQGWVVEARMTPTQGAVATLLLKEGQLNKGDVVLAGRSYGRIRTMTDSLGRSLKKATSSMPVEISGLDSVPQAGDRFFSLQDDLNRAKAAAEENQARSREETLARRSQITLDNLFSQIEAGNVKELNVIVKADVQGSVDVLIKYLTELSTDEVQVRIIHAAVGGVNEGDVVLAEASGAIIIGFNAVADERVKEIAESRGVEIRFYNVIYRITEDLRSAMVGMLEPEYQEKHLGNLIVRETFKVSSLGTIAGCYVTSGIVQKKSSLRLIRDGIVVKDKCVIESLKHFKDDAREVRAGLECGIKIAGFDDLKRDDTFEAYEIVEVARTL